MLITEQPRQEPTMNYTFGKEFTALLPTGTKIDVQRPETATYYDPDQVAYVLRDVDNLRRIVVATSFGSVESGWKLGSIQHARHDQRCSNIGTFVVIGIVDFQHPLHAAGEFAFGKRPHWVFK
jgi:hypothetical protein